MKKRGFALLPWGSFGILTVTALGIVDHGRGIAYLNRHFWLFYSALGLAFLVLLGHNLYKQYKG